MSFCFLFFVFSVLFFNYYISDPSFNKKKNSPWNVFLEGGQSCPQYVTGLLKKALEDIDQFQITGFHHSVLVWQIAYGFIKCFAWDLLLCPFHKKLKKCEKISLFSSQTNNVGFRCIIVLLYCYWRGIPSILAQKISTKCESFWFQFFT